MQPVYKRFALTGGIACGKSTISHWIVQWGGQVLDADHVGHALMGPDGRLVGELTKVFGVDIAASDGGIDRKRLAAKVFGNPARLARLEALMHPDIQAEVVAWLNAPLPPSASFKVAVVPLLFECGWHEKYGWDAVIAVLSERRHQIERLKARGLTGEDAQQRIDSQMSAAGKARLADYVINNNAGLSELFDSTRKIFQVLLERDL